MRCGHENAMLFLHAHDMTTWHRLLEPHGLVYIYSGTLECDHPGNLTTLLIRPLSDRPILVFLYN